MDFEENKSESEAEILEDEMPYWRRRRAEALLPFITRLVILVPLLVMAHNRALLQRFQAKRVRHMKKASSCSSTTTELAASP